jgi:hypothetical protein
MQAYRSATDDLVGLLVGVHLADLPDLFFLNGPHLKGTNSVRASPAGHLAPDGCKFRPGEVHVSSGEPRTRFEFKYKVDEKHTK